MRSNAIVSISARWARERPTPSVASGCRRKAPGIAISPAFTPRSACRSGRARRPSTRWRSWPRSPRSCGCPRKKKKPRHEIRSRQSGGRDRRRHRSHPASGIAGAEEGHHDWCCRSRGADPLRGGGRKRVGGGRKAGPSPGAGRAASIAQAIAGDGVNVERAFTGRANLFAAKAGVLVVDRAAVDRINGVDEAITFATLASFKPVAECEMIATAKLLLFGVEAKLRDAAVAVAGQGALRIAPYTIKRVGVVSTMLPGL